MRVFTLSVSVVLILSLLGCASMARDTAATDADTVVVIGVSLSGLPVQRLGHHYQLNFVNAEGGRFQVTRQLRTTDHFIVISGMPPGDWTWESFSPRTTPGVSGFESLSARARPVLLEFPLADQSAVMLSQQLLITHSEGILGGTATQPSTTSLQPSVQDRITRWLQAQPSQRALQLTPVGVLNIPETESTPSLFDLLFGA